MTNREEENTQESYASMVNNNALLLSFEGWIKYVEGFTRGLQASKTVETITVMETVGEIMEYMQVVRQKLFALLQYCESVLEKNELLEEENKELKRLLEDKKKKKEG